MDRTGVAAVHGQLERAVLGRDLERGPVDVLVVVHEQPDRALLGIAQQQREPVQPTAVEVLGLVDHECVVLDVEKSRGLDELVCELAIPELGTELVPVGLGQLQLRLTGERCGQAVYASDVQSLHAEAPLAGPPGGVG